MSNDTDRTAILTARRAGTDAILTQRHRLQDEIIDLIGEVDEQQARHARAWVAVAAENEADLRVADELAAGAEPTGDRSAWRKARVARHMEQLTVAFNGDASMGDGRGVTVIVNR